MDGMAELFQLTGQHPIQAAITPNTAKAMFKLGRNSTRGSRAAPVVCSIGI
jgi:hypothetical protein